MDHRQKAKKRGTVQFLGIKLKPYYRLKNLMAIPSMNMGNGVFLFFFNVQLVFLLRSPDYFNVPNSEIG